MHDDVYSKALARRRELQDELKRLDDFIRTFDELVKTLVDRQKPDTTRTSAGATEVTPQAELERIAVSVLREHGAPLMRQPLYEKVKARGAVVGGSDELVNFGTKMSRAKKTIVNLTGHGYWPANEPYEPAGYVSMD